MDNKLIKVVSFSLPLIWLAGCDNNSSTNPDFEPSNDVETATGVFLDSPIANIGYRTDTQEGVTNSEGEYSYIEGESVTFFIGDLLFPAVAASGVVTPLDIADSEDPNEPAVVNMVRLLQTLDEDGDPDNGITITETAKSTATAIDFTQSVEDFASSTAVTELISNAGQDSPVSELISASDALDHFVSQLADNDIFSSNDMVGYWDILGEQPNDPDFDEDFEVYNSDGTFDSACNEDFVSGSYTISSTGEVTQTYNEEGEEPEVLTGQMNDARDQIVFQVEGEEVTLVKVLQEPNSCTSSAPSEEEGTSVDDSGNSAIVGAWRNTTSENDFLAFVFLADGTYIHAEVDDSSNDEISGMEWGTYARSSSTGKMVVTQEFDNNGDTGLTDNAEGLSNLFIEVSGDTLTASFDDDLDGTIDGSYEFTRNDSDGIVGAWQNTDSENDLLAFVFFDDGTYIHAEVDFDDTDEMSGMEWGTYSQDSETGEMTVTQTFDNNGDTGLTDNAEGLSNLFIEVSGDDLTASFDDDLDDTIDGSIEFLRQPITLF